MPYKEYKPDSVDKVVIDEIEFEVNKFTDKENIYWCGKCGEACPVEFYYINDCALCSDKCKDEYLEDVKKTQEGSKQMQAQLDRMVSHQTKLGAQPQPGPGGTTAIPIVNPGAFLSGGKKTKKGKKNQNVAPASFCFAVHVYSDMPGIPVVTINTISCWQQNGYLIDQYTAKEQAVLDPILQKYNLAELMESQFEHDGQMTEAQLIAALQQEGLVFDASFQQFMQ
jgi:hypothetical protein